MECWTPFLGIRRQAKNESSVRLTQQLLRVPSFAKEIIILIEKLSLEEKHPYQ